MGWLRYTNQGYILGGIMNEKMKNMLASYGRSVLGAATAMYAAGVTDPETLVYSLVGALVPVALRAVNPNDKSFGRMPAESDVAAALKDVKVVKKKAAKKPADKK
jgi:hypothetical protein